MTLDEQLQISWIGRETVRFDEEIALVGVDYRWNHRIIDEMVRFWADVERIIDLPSDEKELGRYGGGNWFVIEIAIARGIGPQCKSRHVC